MILPILLFIGCDDKGEDSGLDLNSGPIMTFEEPFLELVSGDILDLRVQAEDEDGVNEVKLYYRQTGGQFWDNIVLDESGDMYSGQIEAVTEPGIDFYFRATDKGNPQAYSLLPTEGADAPYSYTVAPSALPIPFYESFELESGESGLIDMNWWTPTDGRSTFAFDLTQSQSQSGNLSVYHSRGAAEVPELSDWLISPPLDFSSAEGVMVGWWERVSASEVSAHSLWVSTGARLPEDGDYVELSTLEPIGIGGWTRYRYIDLSDYSGETLVYLAWRWEGTLADDWYIDDIEVRELGPDIITSLSSDEPVAPGDEITIEVTVENLTNGIGENLTVVLGLPDGGGQFIIDEFDISTLPAMGTEVLTAQLQLDSELAENRYLPISVNVLGEDISWEDTHEILIGVPSLFQMTMEVANSGNVQVVIGVGEPDNPVWTETILNGNLDLGSHDIQTEITDQFASLPPEPGENRWFIEIESDIDASLTTASINYGESVYASSSNVLIPSGFPEVVYIPEPPDFSFLSSLPNSFEPGELNTPLSITIYNLGAEAQGSVTATITTTEPDVTVMNGESILVGPWAAQTIQTIQGASISISEDHVDSTPIHLILTLVDDIESWEIPVDISVPWPVMRITQVEILDGDDGQLEEGENVQLRVTVANTGGRSAFGPVTGELELLQSSTASATVINDSPSFGFLSVNDVDDDDDFYLENITGSIGDTLELKLILDDGAYQYSDTVELTLGEAPWLSLSPFDDASDDALSENAVDILSASYRLEDSDILALRIHSANTIDPATAFVEAWGSSGGSDFIYFRWVLQSGVGTLQGYRSGTGFQNIGTLDVEYESSNSVTLRWDHTAMGLAQNTISIGLASGWCGPPNYYCDHYPDNWGYPYVSFSSGIWYSLSF